MIVFWIVVVSIVLFGGYWVWDRLFNPYHCTCGAPEMLQFGVYIDHSRDCPARKR